MVYRVTYLKRGTKKVGIFNTMEQAEREIGKNNIIDYMVTYENGRLYL